MTALLEAPNMVDPFLNATFSLPATRNDPTPLWLNPLDISQYDPESLIQSLRDQKVITPKSLCPAHEYKPPSQPARQTSRSKSYISRRDVSPEKAKQLEHNRIAANKSHLKKKKEHKEIQSRLDSEAAKRETLLAEITLPKDEIWHLKKQMIEHTAKCDDQSIYNQLRMTHDEFKEKQDMKQDMKCPSLSFSVSTSSERSVENGDSEGIESGALEEFPGIAPEECGDGLFDSFIDVSQV